MVQDVGMTMSSMEVDKVDDRRTIAVDAGVDAAAAAVVEPVTVHLPHHHQHDHHLHDYSPD